MKQLQLDLNKRLLIWESENFDESQLDENNKITLFHNGNILKFICKGSELSEEILNDLVEPKIFTICASVMDRSKSIIVEENIETFTHELNIEGYYWGENPVEKISKAFGVNHVKTENEAIYEEAESRTFNPEKTLIFEIL